MTYQFTCLILPSGSRHFNCWQASERVTASGRAYKIYENLESGQKCYSVADAVRNGMPSPK